MTNFFHYIACTEQRTVKKYFNIQIATEERFKSASLMRLKKLYVMAALLIEDYHNQVILLIRKSNNWTIPDP